MINVIHSNGTSFKGLRDAGDPLELAQRYNEQSADELVFLDIAATLERLGMIQLRDGRYVPVIHVHMY